VALGPGKADLLEAIRETGSIAAAGRRMGMSYQRAHDLASALNADFRAPLIETSAGGSRGGGARLTALGEEVLAAYRAVERQAEVATAERLEWLRRMLAG
jgi:molybdate transport system regulatory protein